MATADLARIRSEVSRRALSIGASGYVLPTYGQSEDAARPHIEADGRGYHYVVVERGQELKRVTTQDLDDLLYAVFEGVTFSLACDYELSHRQEKVDSRRLLFAKQLELLGRLEQRWRLRA